MPENLVAFIADAQLGKRLYGLQETHQDWLDAFLKACSITASLPGVKAVFFLGDTFDADCLYPKEIVTAQKGVAMLKEAGIACYGILGNHDKGQLEAQDKVISWFDVCGIETMHWAKPVMLQGSTKTYAFVGVHHHPKNKLQALLKTLPNPKADTNVVLLHQALKELGPENAGWEVECDQIPDWAHRVFLGDFHNASSFQDPKGRLFTYPGSIETVSFNQETEPGFITFDLDTHMVRHYSTKQRDYIKTKLSREPNYKEKLLKEIAESTAKMGQKRPAIQIEFMPGDEQILMALEKELCGRVIRIQTISPASLPETPQASAQSFPQTPEELLKLALDLLPKNDLAKLSADLLSNPSTSVLRDWQEKNCPKATLRKE
jgi:DNA repair exonuclease SbcCD nuclease subunit